MPNEVIAYVCEALAAMDELAIIPRGGNGPNTQGNNLRLERDERVPLFDASGAFDERTGGDHCGCHRAHLGVWHSRILSTAGETIAGPWLDHARIRERREKPPQIRLG